MNTRDVILGRVRRALADVHTDGGRYEQAVDRRYLHEHGNRTIEQTVDLLADNLSEYRADVYRATPGELPDLITRLLAEHGAQQVLLPRGLPPSWTPDQFVYIPDRTADAHHELDRVGSVLTGCALAIAETGTIVLDGGPGQGRRRITLIPDHHICVVRVPGQVVASVPQALRLLDPTRPLTWISGPSATSDIELDRVEGVHGPRNLDVVLLSDEAGA